MTLSQGLTPLQRKPLYEEVAQQLRQRIFAHAIAPGQTIDELEIARELGISRTPVREALKVLAAEGLVTLLPRRGCVVAEISAKDLDDIFAVLILLEGHAARLAVEHLDDDTLARLTAHHEALEVAFRANDINAFFLTNQAFHREIYCAARNPWLIETIEHLRRKILLSRHQSLFSQGRLLASLEEHRAILAALLTRDPERAEQLMRHHIANGRAAIISRPPSSPLSSPSPDSSLSSP
ncbi:MAG: GntR family transcriptional regulator [Hydrogenophilus sp.]|nr:GntR family transcriptional regulator [Hydrogenophilus sp.]